MGSNTLAVASLGISAIACATAIAVLAERFSYTPTDMAFSNALSERIAALEFARDPKTIDGLTTRVEGVSAMVKDLSQARDELENLRLTVSQLSTDISTIHTGLAEVRGWMKTNSPTVVAERDKELRRELMQLENKRRDLLESGRDMLNQIQSLNDRSNAGDLIARVQLSTVEEWYKENRAELETVDARIIEIRLELDDDK